jgi:hypothetical protein
MTIFPSAWITMSVAISLIAPPHIVLKSTVTAPVPPPNPESSVPSAL